jgi:hypothetical protein
MPIILAVPAVGPMFPSQKRCGLIAAHPFTPTGIAGSGRSFINVANAKPPGGLGVAIALPPNGAVTKKRQKTSLKTRLTFSRHVHSGVGQFEYGFGGAIAPLTATR